MPEKIAPALSAGEWSGRQFHFEYWGECRLHSSGELEVRDQINHPCLLKGPERAKLAAFALHGQLFGFTHDDVWQLRTLASEDGIFGPEDKKPRSFYQPWIVSLADRIESLLPPAPEGAP